MAPARAVTIVAMDQYKWELVSRFMAVTLMRLKGYQPVGVGDDSELDGLIDEILDQLAGKMTVPN